MASTSQCKYCGPTVSSSDKCCPSCGAPNDGYIVDTERQVFLVYKVTEIRIIYPDDVDAVLIQPGKDMVTLMTCHPPNTGGRYRYLVYCERVTEAA